MLDHCLDLFKIAGEYKFTLIMEFDRKFGAKTARFSCVNILMEMKRGSDIDRMRRNIDFAEEFFRKWEMRGRCAAEYLGIFWIGFSKHNWIFIEIFCINKIFLRYSS